MPETTTPGRPSDAMQVTIMRPVDGETAGARTFARVFGWTGATLFVASLAYFSYSYLDRFGVPAARGSWTAAVAWNGLAFTVFAVHHSLFAREPVRRRIRERLAPDMERALYVWVASILFIIVCATWHPVPGVAWQATGISVWLLRAVQAFGVWLTLRSATILGVRTLAGIPAAGARATSAGPADALSRDSEFKTTGPYGWVRHPIYSGWFLVVFCVSPMTMTRLVFAVVSSAYLLIAIPMEERTIRALSDGAYERYMRKVRWRLLPGVY
jgi:protein-S-isoprenylcysteine O-methyltransferase Ste14